MKLIDHRDTAKKVRVDAIDRGQGFEHEGNVYIKMGPVTSEVALLPGVQYVEILCVKQTAKGNIKADKLVKPLNITLHIAAPAD